ncbi:MAG: hypothetical protein V4722_03620 [Bacteroidota bacterium]
MLEIKIPKPCHEDWNAMTPTTRGAFCSACAKEVVDFTKLTDEEVQLYLLNSTGERLCGKFNNTQLHRIRISIPNTIFYSKIAAWKKFMAVVMLAFGTMLFGCDVTTVAAAKNEKGKMEEEFATMTVGMIMKPVHEKMDSVTVNFETTNGAPALIDSIYETVTGISEGDPEIVPPILGAMVLETVPVMEKEVYEMVGGISFVDTNSVKKTKKDSLYTPKATTDSGSCKDQHFY